MSSEVFAVGEGVKIKIGVLLQEKELKLKMFKRKRKKKGMDIIPNQIYFVSLTAKKMGVGKAFGKVPGAYFVPI